MKYSVDNELAEKLIKIARRDGKLFKKIKKKLSIFEENPVHPSLRTHKLEGKLGEYWSISIESNVRMLYRFISTSQGKKVLFFSIGTHSQVYR